MTTPANKIDLHIHTSASPDSNITAAQLKEIFDAGIVDQLAITDHDKIEGAISAQKYFGADKIIIGEEITTDKKKHIIGLFLHKFVPRGLPAVRTAELIRAQGGLVYIPHPFEPFTGVGLDTLT